ncbi:MAG: histidine kinase N-terminal 7TM domain-containing protein [Chloroflexota bacterium]
MIEFLREWLIFSGPVINRSLSAVIAIVAASFFLYSLVKDIRSRVARAFSTLLLFVLITYIGDLGVSYSTGLDTAVPWLRFQWLGIAFVPATYVHLSDAILTMTGVPSRGRRRWAVRSLYVVAGIFLALVLWTRLVVHEPVSSPAPHFRPGPLFGVFVTYFIGSLVSSGWFVIRARNRTLTVATRRRITYLLVPYLAPALAVFPFLLISGETLASTPLFYGVLIVVDSVLTVMLTFMAYPLAFFGALRPDRQVKAEMLQFFLRGPLAGILVLGIIVWVPRASAVLGLPGEEIMPFLAVAATLFFQWMVSIVSPHVKRWLVYAGDQAEIRRIEQIEDRLLTGTDFRQLLEVILATVCDYLQVETAFVASLTEEGAHLEQAIGLRAELSQELERGEALSANVRNNHLPEPADITTTGDFLMWRDFWLIPLHRTAEGLDQLVGVLGVQVPEMVEDTLDDEQKQILMVLAERTAETLEDRRLQEEVFAALDGLLPQITAAQQRLGAALYGGVEALTTPDEAMLNSPAFDQKIKDALSHYWGGPKLTDSALMSLNVVRQALADNDGNPQRAVREVLQRAIESLRPEGQRSMTTTEWILYNILEMRFIQGRKVRDVAMRLAMSESDLYRKQRVAIETVASIIAEMERTTANGG